MPAKAIEQTAPTKNQTAIFVLLFSVAFSWAVFSALGEPEVNFARAVRLIWMSLLFGTVSLTLFIWATGRFELGNYWRMAWTASFLLYFAHFLYGFFVVHEGSLRSIYLHQGAIIASFNLLLTAVWGLDVANAWWCVTRPTLYFRLVVHVVIFLGFAISTLVFGSPMARALGGFMLSVLVGTLIVRLATSSRSADLK
ncbi:hypothetical protein [Mesorhizobium sp. M0019]|uniref:hypothetical protein n=1 Tax=Mesorhizobium sp. M0019 TaxID=2956845 RepID=UPI0033387103